jgi:hypothetical protein
MGGKNGGKKGICMGEKWPAACWVGERKERKGKKKTKEKTGRLLVVGWGRKKTEREKKKKRPAASYLGGRKKTEREKKKKKKAPLCTWLGEWRGKIYIYRRPAIWGAWLAREKKYIAGQMVVWPAREKK